jgi:hypothetical protein
MASTFKCPLHWLICILVLRGRFRGCIMAHHTDESVRIVQVLSGHMLLLLYPNSGGRHHLDMSWRIRSTELLVPIEFFEWSRFLFESIVYVHLVLMFWFDVLVCMNV